jgi:predicted Zn-ribbon and HTH transcriptional regulator
MVAMLKRRTACVCLKCGHNWSSFVKQPKQCPVCKRKDWDGLHNSMGRLLVTVAAGECKCVKCNYEWSPRKPDPRQCPMCKRYDWRGGPAVAAVVSGKPPRRVYRACNWCNGVWNDDSLGKYPGMCPWCGVNFHTGQMDAYGPKPDRETVRETVRRACGGDLTPEGGLTFDPFDPGGALGGDE